MLTANVGVCVILLGEIPEKDKKNCLWSLVWKMTWGRRPWAGVSDCCNNGCIYRELQCWESLVNHPGMLGSQASAARNAQPIPGITDDPRSKSAVYFYYYWASLIRVRHSGQESSRSTTVLRFRPRGILITLGVGEHAPDASQLFSFQPIRLLLDHDEAGAPAVNQTLSAVHGGDKVEVSAVS